MSKVVLPFDSTGEASTNFIQNELRTLTEVNASTYRIIVPTYAPFYLTNLLVEHVDTAGQPKALVENVDYYPCLPYMAASRSIGKAIYGGISIINEHKQGTIRISYQALGGKWTADDKYVYNQLLTTVYNRRTTWWDLLTNVQDTFPPKQHGHTADDIEGHKEVLKALDEIRVAILKQHSSVPDLINRLAAHIGSHGNVHHLHKNDIELGLVENRRFATDVEVLQRQEEDVYISLRQVILLLKDIGVI